LLRATIDFDGRCGDGPWRIHGHLWFGAGDEERPDQPAELAAAYVMLADPLSSHVSGATIAVTGGKPIL
jgi:hypothetical protein